MHAELRIAIAHHAERPDDGGKAPSAPALTGFALGLRGDCDALFNRAVSAARQFWVGHGADRGSVLGRSLRNRHRPARVQWEIARIRKISRPGTGTTGRRSG